MAKEKENKVKDKINWKKEARLAPGYIIVIAWVVFTLVLFWVGLIELSFVDNKGNLCRRSFEICFRTSF